MGGQWGRKRRESPKKRRGGALYKYPNKIGGEKKKMKKIIAILIVVTAIFIMGLTPTVNADELTFSQVDFVFTKANVPNSDWGRIEVDVAESTANQGLNEGYLNIYTDGGWVVQNMLIDDVSRMDNVAMYFDLGVPVGTDVTSLSAYLEFTADPLVTFGDGPRSNYDVDTVYYNAEGFGFSTTTTISTPMPLLVFNPTGETYLFIKPNKKGENQETANNQCAPMAIANSLQYLKNRYGLPVPHVHKKGLKGDKSLVGKLDSACKRGVRSRKDGDPVGFIQLIKGKFDYLKGNGLADKLIHKHQGHNGDITHATITSKDESVGGHVTFEWLCEQLKKCEDVEIGYLRDGGGGHFVRVFGCGKVYGIPFLLYKHDAEQSDRDTNDERGLEENIVFVPDLDGDGMPNFGSRNREITVAISESPKPPVEVPAITPLSFLLALLSLLGLGAIAMRKMYRR